MKRARTIPANKKRQAANAKEAVFQAARTAGAQGVPMTWGNRAKGAAPLPKTCETCLRGQNWMRQIEDGRSECSHIECPHRKSVTARGGDYYDGSAA